MGCKMRTGVLLVFFAFCFVYIKFSTAAATGEKSCKMIVSELTKLQLNEISNCTKHLHYKTGKEKSQKSSCVMKCVMRNVNVLNKDYKTDKAALDVFAEQSFPEGEIRERAKPLFYKCLESGAALNPEEEVCKSYDAYLKCLAAAIPQICPT